MTYHVKEIYFTLQGEGANTGRAAVFLRFAGCNLWSGRERDRSTAVCQFCDTEFVGTDGPGGGAFERAGDVAAAVDHQWPADASEGRFVVCTGGEPLLQFDDALVEVLHARGFEVAVETNGTLPTPAGIDWVCVSPKAGADFVLLAGDELKLVYPQDGSDPNSYEHLDFKHFFLQPMDGPARAENTERAIAYCTQHPRWRLSLQVHKLIGMP